MHQRTFRFAILLALALALTAVGCNTIPLGDPEKSTSDAALAGWWDTEKPGNLVYIQIYDKHTYLISLYSYENNAGTIKTTGKFTTKAWTTKVGGIDIMTFQIVDPEWDAQGGPDSAARYSYFQIRKLPGGKIELHGMNDQFLKDAKTPAELEKKIADNVKNEALWKDNEPTVFQRVPDDKHEEMKAILTAFAPAAH